MGTQNALFNEVANSIFKFSSDTEVLDQCHKIEDREIDIQRIKDDNEALKKQVADDAAIQLADMGTQLADKDSQLADMSKRLAVLESMLLKPQNQ